MSYKPDDNTLIAYLYGELDEKEEEKLTQHLEEHPEDRKRVQDLASVRSMIGHIGDKEVIAPPVFVDDQASRMPFWVSSSFRWVSGIAATMVFLMVAAKLLGVEVLYSNNEVRISMGGRQSQPAVQPGMTPEQVQLMITSSVVKNNEFIASQWADHQKKIDQSIRAGLDLNSKKVEHLMQNASLASQEQVKTFVDGLQSENLRSIKGYLQLSADEQKKYVEGLLVDFSKYLQEQRNQDLTAFQTQINSMENNTNQFKQETEQILSSIISSTGGKKQTNY